MKLCCACHLARPVVVAEIVAAGSLGEVLGKLYFCMHHYKQHREALEIGGHHVTPLG